MLKVVHGRKPLLLLDDVFSELDNIRRHELTTYLGNCQTFITATDADIISKSFNNDIKICFINT